MNRNVLKIIALVTMFIDHVGAVFFPDILILRIIGRLSMPIFACFISDGYRYTSNRKKYVLLLFIFMLISWAPFCIAFGYNFYISNILGVFLLSLLVIFLIEKIKASENYKVTLLSVLLILIVAIIAFDIASIVPEGIWGVMLPVVFYFFKEKPIIKYVLSALTLILMSLKFIILEPTSFLSYIQLFSLLSLILIAFYNNQKGKLNLKYLFYISYPSHLIILYLLNLII